MTRTWWPWSSVCDDEVRQVVAWWRVVLSRVLLSAQPEIPSRTGNRNPALNATTHLQHVTWRHTWALHWFTSQQHRLYPVFLCLCLYAAESSAQEIISKLFTMFVMCVGYFMLIVVFFIVYVWLHSVVTLASWLQYTNRLNLRTIISLLWKKDNKIHEIVREGNYRQP